MHRERSKRVDVGDITLVWGDATTAKAELRDEAVRHYLSLPIAERLRIALSLVRRRREHDPRT